VIQSKPFDHRLFRDRKSGNVLGVPYLPARRVIEGEDSQLQLENNGRVALNLKWLLRSGSVYAVPNSCPTLSGDH